MARQTRTGSGSAAIVTPSTDGDAWQAQGHWSEQAGAVCQRQALERQAEECDRYWRRKRAVWVPQQSMLRCGVRNWKRGRNCWGSQQLPAAIVEGRLQRWNRNSRLVAEILTIRLAEGAPVIKVACMRRLRCAVMSAAWLRCMFAVRPSHRDAGRRSKCTQFVQAGAQASVGDPGCDAEQPHAQQAGCPAAKLFALAEHGDSSDLHSVLQPMPISIRQG